MNPRKGGIVDTQLVRLVRAAEAGQRCPPVRVFAGSALYLGTPGPSSVFAEFMREPLAEVYTEVLSKRPRRERKQDPGDPWAMASEALEVLSPARPDDGEPTALTLLRAQWWPVGPGDGLNVPAIRIPLAAVDSWWLAGGSTAKAPGSGPSVFAGIVTPVDWS
jgi:hypothetical protein